MRIGVFVDMYLPHVSGVTNHISLYKRRWESLGHEVFVFTFGDLDHADAEPNIIRTHGIPWGDTGWRFSPRFSSRAREIIPTLDIAHAHHPFQSGRLALPLCRRYGIPLAFTNHTRYDLYSDEYARFFPQALRYEFIRRQLGEFASACDLVIAPAPSIAVWLEEFAGYADATVIPNGIDVDRFSAPAAPVSRTELGFSAGDVVFCYAGRLGPEKNTVWLAEEFAHAHAACPTAKLLVIGGGPSREDAEDALRHRRVSDAAVFLGMQPYDRLPDLEAAADAFVTGSVSEVHPLVVLEAMAAGLPVIAVHSPGITETVTDGASGLLAGLVEPGALAARIERLVRDEDLRARLSDGASRAARAYSLERTADVVLEHFERLAARTRP